MFQNTLYKLNEFSTKIAVALILTVEIDINLTIKYLILKIYPRNQSRNLITF